MLNNVTTGSVLTAQSHTAEATSEKVTQLIINDDYRKAKDMRAWFNLPSICNVDVSSQRGVDTFVTDHPLVAGDTIVVNNNGSYENLTLTAEMITPATNAFLIPIPITSTTTYGEISTSYNEPDIWKILNPGYNSTEVYFGGATNVSIVFAFPEAKTVHSIYVNFYESEAYNFYGSNNGVDYTLLGSGGTYITGTLNIATPGSYTHYKMVVTSTLMRMRQLFFFGEGVNINTSSITAGNTPGSAYILPDLQINEVPLVEDTTTRFMTGTTTATAAIRYNDIVMTPTRTVETNIKFNKYKNQLTEFTKFLYEIDLDRGNEIHTSNIAPLNTVSVEGANAPIATDAYLAFDGTTNPALTVPTDATGVVDISHIYMFDTPTTIYKLQTDYGLAIEAPMEYTVSGSFDGVAYTQLLSVSQDVAIDDLSLTKSFDINLYDAYKYYKIHITLGNPNSNVSFKQYTLLKESSVDVF